MASADDIAAQLPADPGFLTPPSRVVTRGSFCFIPCREGPGCLVSRDELRKLVKHERAPHPVLNPAQPGRSTARNATSDEESGKQYFKFRLNFIGYHLLLRSTADCCRRNVQAHLMMSRTMRGMLLQSTLLIKEAQWTQLRLSKIYGTKQSNSCTRQDRTCNPDTLEKQTTSYLFEPIEMPKVSCSYMCPHDLLCQCGAGIRVRITETKHKLILEFKGTHDKNSHSLRIMHARSSAPGVGGIKSYMSDNSNSDNSAKFQAIDFIRSKIPYSPLSPVLQELRRKGNAKYLYRRNLNGISDSDSYSDSDTSSVPQQIRVRRDRCLKRINASAAGVAYSRLAYDSPNSKDVTEVEYATEWYSESPGRQSL
jgi:hypothetical protein